MKTLIQNGLIVDGTGAPAFSGDVVVEGACVAAVVPRAPGGAEPRNGE